MAVGLKTGGRKKGTRNKKTIASEAATERALGKLKMALGEDFFEGDAHEFLMSVYRDKAQLLNFRVESAGKAIPYEKPKLMAHTVEGGKEPIKLVVEWSQSSE